MAIIGLGCPWLSDFLATRSSKWVIESILIRVAALHESSKIQRPNTGTKSCASDYLFGYLNVVPPLAFGKRRQRRRHHHTLSHDTVYWWDLPTAARRHFPRELSAPELLLVLVVSCINTTGCRG